MTSQKRIILVDGVAYETTEGENLLSSLLSQGVDVRFGCRAGVCGACRLFDQGADQSVLACQTSVQSSMTLLSKLPSKPVVFSVLSCDRSTETSVALTLLGASDESFGDRVSVSLSDDQDAVFYDCMALNSAGAPLSIVLQESQLKGQDWQRMQALATGDSLFVSVSAGVRKGRLLYEMDVAESPVAVVLSLNNQVFESYWHHALLQMSADYLGHCVLPTTDNPIDALQDEKVVAFLTEAAQRSRVGFTLIYHGQNISADAWNTTLRSLRVRTKALHFVR
ncbi:2Fe-2S iron-sulfur cluster binding domain-containing protein [Marinomonas sp. A79]|uniref:2Fe-2S iron-sulfur cluster binding domain-containing protein n=1 Tax=Marinomonas vulgaris TaxID=2823372 RepID=A0ABS5H8J3_9GAMM|nr:2Fe-2S iron-sulfur cluster binding domain-containing protein [Marinomonas vulgaris]MBR7888013.1 2Fe-2S iron-sulfur cluster binding domain-containing protein [Marinomonas vulgaris]